MAPSFFERHRNKLLAVGGLVIGYYFGKRWLADKVKDLNEKADAENRTKDNILLRFRQNQQDCTFTVLSLLPGIADHLFGTLNVEAVTEELKASRNGKRSGAQSDEEQRAQKYEQWEKVKILSFTRTFACIYALVLLIALTRIQINILGRRAYLETLASQQQRRPKSRKETDEQFETERAFLSASWWFLNRGIRPLTDRIHAKVKDRLGRFELMFCWSIQNRVSAQEMDELIDALRRDIDGDKLDILAYLLPPSGQETEHLIGAGHDRSRAPTNSEDLAALFSETRRWLSSDDMANTVRGMLDTALEMLAGRLSNVFISSPAVSAVSLDLRNSESAEEVRTLTVPLVGLLPTVSRQAQAIVKQVPNAYAEAIDDIQVLDALAALIYTQ